jgi:hypothetical protein
MHLRVYKDVRAAISIFSCTLHLPCLLLLLLLLLLRRYVAVMARLHLNTFKVEATFPIDWSQGHAAAAAMLGGDAASAGSALYLLGSLFNHSCEPNVHVTFPGNDSTAVFTAARQIAAGEQLFITYIDAGQELDARQEYLAFAYGFRWGGEGGTVHAYETCCHAAAAHMVAGAAGHNS